MAAKKTPDLVGKHLEIVPLWHSRNYVGVLDLGRSYEILGTPPKHYTICIGTGPEGQKLPYKIKRTHAFLIDAEFSGDL